MPVQRIPRYQMLLQDLIRKSPKDHPDIKQTLLALEQIKSTAVRINAVINEAKASQTFLTLCKRIQNFSKLQTSGRKLLREGPLGLRYPLKDTHWFVLFDDIIAIAVRQKSGYILSDTINLNAVWTDDLGVLDPRAGAEVSFEIVTPEQTMTVYAPSFSEKVMWLTAIDNAITARAAAAQRSVNKSLGYRRTTFDYKNGTKYDGEWLDGLFDGNGTLKLSNGNAYSGTFESGQMAGRGVMEFATEEKYSGGWEDGRPHGNGSLKITSGDSYTGNWVEGARDGDGTIQYAIGDVVTTHWTRDIAHGHTVITHAHNYVSFDGEFVNGVPHGKGNFTDVYGGHYAGDWSHGVREGSGKFSSQTEEYSGSWMKDRYHGDGVLNNKATGMIYDGQFSEGLFNGHGKLTDTLRNTVYEGEFVMGQKQGNGVDKSLSVINDRPAWSYTGAFLHNQYHGSGRMIYLNGDVYEGTWCMGVRQGKGVMTYVNGSKYDGEWMDDMSNGNGIYMYYHGAVYEGQWSRGQRHGKGVYIDNKRHYRYDGGWYHDHWFGTGVINSDQGKFEGTWKGTRPHGILIWHNLTGTRREIPYNEGIPSGEGSVHYKSGTVMRLIYNDGVLIYPDTCEIAPMLPIPEMMI